MTDHKNVNACGECLAARLELLELEKPLEPGAANGWPGGGRAALVRIGKEVRFETRRRHPRHSPGSLRRAAPRPLLNLITYHVRGRLQRAGVPPSPRSGTAIRRPFSHLAHHDDCPPSGVVAWLRSEAAGPTSVGGLGASRWLLVPAATSARPSRAAVHHSGNVSLGKPRRLQTFAATDFPAGRRPGTVSGFSASFASRAIVGPTGRRNRRKGPAWSAFAPPGRRRLPHLSGVRAAGPGPALWGHCTSARPGPRSARTERPNCGAATTSTGAGEPPWTLAPLGGTDLGRRDHCRLGRQPGPGAAGSPGVVSPGPAPPGEESRSPLGGPALGPGLGVPPARASPRPRDRG